MTGVDFGRRMLVVRPVGRVPVRPLVVCLLLLAATAVITVLSLGTGEFEVPPAEVVRALTGQGSGAFRLVVVEWRLPRVLLALMIGVALGLSGAIFQALTRNPLGSPDVIGLDQGAFTGVLATTVLVGSGSYYVTATGALIGGLATALAVYVFAFKRGVQGFRLIIVGIAISAMLASVNQWFMIKVDVQVAYAASLWGQGSLNGLGWAQVTPVAVSVGLLCVALAGYGQSLAVCEMGEDAAAGLGVPVERTRLAYLVIGVGLMAAATAAAGPIAFVALAAPQLARRLTGSPGTGLTSAAVMGAFLLTFSDWLAQRLFSPTQLPVGVVTVAVGGVYFVWLLIRQGQGSAR